jgi:hypothetical protein
MSSLFRKLTRCKMVCPLCRLRLALLASGMLAFDEEMLPIWILSQLVWPRNRPVANVVAIFVIAVTVIPILLAHCLIQDTSEVAGLGSSCADGINPTGYNSY